MAQVAMTSSADAGKIRQSSWCESKSGSHRAFSRLLDAESDSFSAYELGKVMCLVRWEDGYFLLIGSRSREYHDL